MGLNNKLTKVGTLLWVILLLGGLDQGLKYNLSWLEQRNMHWWIVDLTWFKNPGIAFSINLPLWIAITLIIILLGILVRLFLLSRGKNWAYDWGLILTICGGLSNLWDKLFFSYVRDFVAIGPLPVFNLADILIFVGVLLIIWGAIYGERYQKI